ncbi:MAG TPA: DegT/DnrJ/EryC1/StrS family aminotransferase, partial [Bacteroidetes bacterium]|nr:DegT/DnrJ/EryC1/StrS family aminotransferase [Bacteroidota bacterium]
MIKYSMVDLRGQYKKIKPEVDAAISEVLDSTAFINGPAVKTFQKNLEEYLGVKHVIPCGNGTDALQVALMALELQPGDEVITTSFTFIATAEVIALLKLTPVLVDVDPDTFNIDPKAIEHAITPKTKVIIPVHLFGQCADMHTIKDIAKKHNLYVVEDTAQAIGAEYTCYNSGNMKKAGTLGDIGCTSFFPSKNLGCYGDGGAICTNNDDLAAQMRSVVNHGIKVRYYHDFVGINSRLDSIQAAVL